MGKGDENKWAILWYTFPLATGPIEECPQGGSIYK